MNDDSEKMAMREALADFRVMLSYLEYRLRRIADYDYDNDPLVVRDLAREALRSLHEFKL